jgi:hypothetical protein
VFGVDEGYVVVDVGGEDFDDHDARENDDYYGDLYDEDGDDCDDDYDENRCCSCS